MGSPEKYLVSVAVHFDIDMMDLMERSIKLLPSFLFHSSARMDGFESVAAARSIGGRQQSRNIEYRKAGNRS